MPSFNRFVSLSWAMASSTPASATTTALFQARARAIEKCWLLIMLRQLPNKTPRMMQMHKVTSKTLAFGLLTFVVLNFIDFFVENALGLIADHDLSLLHVLRVRPVYYRAAALP